MTCLSIKRSMRRTTLWQFFSRRSATGRSTCPLFCWNGVDLSLSEQSLSPRIWRTAGHHGSFYPLEPIFAQPCPAQNFYAEQRRALLCLIGDDLFGTLIAISLASRWDKPTLLRMELVAKFGILLCIADNLVINLLKILWNRARFDEMAASGDFSAFSPWYLPGGNGGTSFPSGHTAAACGILVLLLLPSFLLSGEEKNFCSPPAAISISQSAVFSVLWSAGTFFQILWPLLFL